jgi:single-strand DNA-binding protein
MDTNIVVLLGRLTRDPEIRNTQDGSAVASFSLAVNRRKKPDEDHAEADFPRCVAFGKTAEIAEKFCRKGKRVCIRGHIRTGKYTNKEGATVYTTDVYVDSLQVVDWPDDGSGYRAPAGAAAQDGLTDEQRRMADECFGPGWQSEEDDDIPF